MNIALNVILWTVIAGMCVLLFKAVPFAEALITSIIIVAYFACSYVDDEGSGW